MIVEAVVLWRNDHQTLLQEGSDDVAFFVLLQIHHLAIRDIEVGRPVIDGIDRKHLSCFLVFPNATSVSTYKNAVVMCAQNGAHIQITCIGFGFTYNICLLVVDE